MKTQSPVLLIAALCVAAIGLVACHTAAGDWQKASSENTIAAYQGFVTAHPTDRHTSEAQAMILQLRDDDGWADAQRVANVAAYQSYLQKFPSGSHAAAANSAIATMDRAAAWNAAKTTGTADALQAFLQKYPTSPESDQARTQLKNLGGYRVRLASEPSAAKAERRLTKLKAHFGEEVETLVVTPDADGKKFYVDSEDLTQQAANIKCEAIKRAHQTCEVVGAT